MFLTASNLVHYLVARGDISPASVVDGNFMAQEAGRRNRNFKVFCGAGQGIFIKQIQSLDAAAISTLQREASCYHLVNSSAEYGVLSELMPRMLAYDTQRHCLLLELLPEGENLSEYHARLRAYPPAIGQLLGQSLGSYHLAVRGRPLQTAELASFLRQPPWILQYHLSPASNAPGSSLAVQQFVRLIRGNSRLCAHLQRLQQHWCFDSIIHGDMKWENCMVFANHDASQRLKIIDWELVDYGDASWDIGAIFQAYLAHWMFAQPVNSTHPMWADAHLQAMLPALQAFWQAYCVTAQVPFEKQIPYLLRSLEYAAARMLQTAFEALHAAPSIPPTIFALIQLADNLLADVQTGAYQLLGIVRES